MAVSSIRSVLLVVGLPQAVRDLPEFTQILVLRAGGTTRDTTLLEGRNPLGFVLGPTLVHAASVLPCTIWTLRGWSPASPRGRGEGMSDLTLEQLALRVLLDRFPGATPARDAADLLAQDSHLALPTVDVDLPDRADVPRRRKRDHRQHRHRRGPWGPRPNRTVRPGEPPGGDRPVVLQVRDAHRRPEVLVEWAAVVVEWGWPGPYAEAPRICTRGYSRPGAAAVTELLRKAGCDR